MEINTEIANTLLAKAGLQPVQSTQRIAEGMINHVYALGESYVLKVNTGHPNQPKLAREQQVYRHAKHVPLPKCYAYDNSRKDLPYEYIILENAGTSLTQNWKDHKTSWLEKVGETLGQIHANHYDTFGDFDSSGATDYSTHLSKYSQQILDAVEQSKELSSEVVTKLKRTYSSLATGAEKPSLVHGNFAAANLLHKGDTITAVIDFEWARADNPELELATFLHRQLHNDPSEVATFLRGYRRHCDVADGFSNRIAPYALLYFLKVLPDVAKWTHKPEKQVEYRTEVQTLLGKVLND